MADGLAARIQRLEQQIAVEEATIRRMIVRGVAQQSAEDNLRRLEGELARLKDQLKST
jgi:uncharacterized coiled-coil protein SlyX